MSSNYLNLVNRTLRRLNEVEVTQSQFPTVRGFQAHVKDAINDSIRDIIEQEFQWPFTHDTQQDVLTPGTITYSFPADMQSVDFDTFRMREVADVGEEKYLTSILYEEYVRTYRDNDAKLVSGEWSIPLRIFRTQSNGFGVSPPPDLAYTVEYEYFSLPVPLSLYSDTSVIPEAYDRVIVDGAMYHSYMFRENTEAAQVALKRFQSGVKHMRSLLINRTDYVTSTMIMR